MLNKSEKILMSLNSKKKSLCQLATTELYSKETNNRKQQKNDKSTFASDALDEWLLVYPATRTLNS